MSTKQMQDDRVAQCRLVQARLQERLVKLNGQLRDHQNKTSVDDDIYADLRARRFEVQQCVTMLRQALR